jgi:acetylglutamate kinase
MIRVLKIGGNQLDEPTFVEATAQAVKRMSDLPIIVHGGGKGIKALIQKMGVEPQYVDGRRITDPSTLKIIMMVLCGQVNLMLVAALINAGVEAQGFNGVDRYLIRAKPVLRPNGSLGRVGEITSVRTEILRDTLAAHIVPVIAPILLGEDGGFFNVNADKAAGVIAATIGAEQVVFLTDVPGVLNNGTLLRYLTQTQAQQLTANGIVTGGMAVKLNAAMDALQAGVQQAVITDLPGLEQGTGTIVSLQ